jgi:plastocyanin
MSNEDKPKKGNMMWYIVAVVVIVVIVVGAVAYYETLPKGTPANAIQLTWYAGQVSDSAYGFGTTSTVTSPGPQLTLTSGTKYTMTVNNVGTMPHNWAIVNAKATNAQVLWGAQIDSAANPIPAESSGSVTFTAGAAGTYYYICQISGHVDLGMWGTVVVE